MNKSLADLIELIISDWKKFAAFCALVASMFLLLLGLVWFVPKALHVNTSQLTISTTGSQIQFTSYGHDQDQYYLVVVPQTTWQPTHIHVKKGAKITIVADGRVNVDFYGLSDSIGHRHTLEQRMKRLHPDLSKDSKHEPEEYFSAQDWQSLVPLHYWTDPKGESTTAFAGRQKYKLAPEEGEGALLGMIATNEDADCKGTEPPTEQQNVFYVGSRWPNRDKEEGAPGSGCLWLAINDVVEPESAFPKAKGVRLSDLFLMDNLGFYRVVVAVPHSFRFTTGL